MTIKTLADFINDQVQYLKAAFPQINVSPGTVMSSLLSIFANVNYQLQTALNTAANDTYIATATGTALDALAFDYAIQRIASVAATGSINLIRQNTVGVLTGSAGQQVSTINADLTKIVTFTTLAPFSFADGQTQTVVSAICNFPGTVGNVGVGMITNIVSPIQGVTGVTNGTAFSGGADRETDAALRQRIQLSTMPQNTVNAITGAILGVSGIATATVFDQQDHLGNVVAYASDNTGTLSPALSNAVLVAANNSKSVGSTVTVYPPTVVYANLAYNYSVQSQYSSATVNQNLQAAISQYFSSLPIGKVFRIFDLQSVIIGSNLNNYYVAGLLDFTITSCSIATPYIPKPWEVVKLGTLTPTLVAEPN